MALHQFPIGASARDSVARWMDGDRPAPGSIRSAATVLLLREAAGGDGSARQHADTGGATGADRLEVFLMRRRASMAFAARMYAFPGGGVDPRDSDIDVPWAGPGPHEWAQRLGCPVELATALVCAAVRELFEECGVLLAGPSADTVVGDVSDDSWEVDRRALLDRSLPLAELLIRRELVLRADLLRPWAHWLTPEFEPRRYDTWFFVAALPAGQVARDVGGESDRTEWVEIGRVLREERAGRLDMMPPTSSTLAELHAVLTGGSSTGATRDPAGGDTVAAALDQVLAAPRHLRRVSPWLVRDAAGDPVMQVDLDGRGGGTPLS